MSEAVVPAREVFRNMPAEMVVVFYVAAAAALGALGFGLWQRVRKYRAGQAAERGVSWPQLFRALRVIASHASLRKRDAFAGWAHALVFWGFATLFAGTVIIALDHDLARAVSPALQFWRGGFYLGFSLVMDVAGIAMLAGLALLAFRRWRFGLAQLDYTRADREPGQYDRRGYVLDDWILLAGLLAVGATGFVVESLRIAADRPHFEVWSVAGWQFANGLEALGLSNAAADRLHLFGFWLHALLALAFIAYLPYSKAIHMLVAIGNLVLCDPLAGKRLPALPKAAASTGSRDVSALTWKELLDLDACTKCGRCHIACPARAGGWPLSPRDLILALREQAESTLGGRTWLHEISAPNTDPPVRAQTLWSCTCCLACVEACPVGVEHVPLIVRMRRALVEDGTLDRGLQAALENLARTGNCFGAPEGDRAKWADGLPFRVKDARTEPVDFLWFVGDYAAFHPELVEITRGVARVFHRAGLDFGILFDGERNSGNDVRRVGEEGLYQHLVETNLEALRRARFREIVTTDPHSYNTLRFEYPEFGGRWRVRHYTEVVAEQIQAGRVTVRTPLNSAATYHDPCHLSRYCGVTEAPRAILRAIGVNVVEMERCRENSFCCGAGGGRVWMTDRGRAERPSEQRIREALRLPGVQYFVTACPKDFVMFRDAARSADTDGRLEVRDLVELIEQGLDGPLDRAAG